MKLFKPGTLTSTLLVVLSCNTVAHSFEIEHPQSRGLGGGVTLRGAVASDLLAVPSSAISGGIHADFGLQRLYDLEELDAAFVAFAYRRGAYTLGIGAQDFGRTPAFGEQTLRLTLSRQFNRFSLALFPSFRRWEFGPGYSALNSTALGMSVGFHHREFSLSVTADNLNRPRPTTNSPVFPRTLAVHTQSAYIGEISSYGSVNLTEHLRPRWGFGQTANLASFFALNWGARTDPLELGGGFVLRKGPVNIGYTGSFHPELGYSHSVTVSY